MCFVPRDRFGTYKIARPFVELSRGTTPILQTPHIGGSLTQETKEDLRIVGLFYYVASYNKNMEQTKVELSRLKLLCERNEIEKHELESKPAIAQ